MTKKNWLRLIVLAALVAVYVVGFTDWFKPRIIHISSTSRSTRVRPHSPGDGGPPVAAPVFIILAEPCQLTELKVVRWEAWRANPEALPVWHLLGAARSVPIAKFPYGMDIDGMEPAVPGAHPQPLEPGVKYHLILKAGSARGEHDFETKAAE